ncbi:helix-turn-helix domain-containing protein [Micromonospora robiginosa]|uniref:Helix-turn-helix domain-containing protein n=1 Tax=Micromonospora robiginosa TaxID=2749844 RepID=A0A7L6BB37_9ACTN|nr:helix-turn-helix domain-containing protein [Micromonospora ferruginea]QLQ39184.1 helix-turn-helix domain-containing protein [Micromonospora ferruginea]
MADQTPSSRTGGRDAGLKEAAGRLRDEGRTVNEIADRLGIAKSTAYRWVGHLPLDTSAEVAVQRRRVAAGRRATRWAERRTQREDAEREAQHRAAEWVGTLARRELLLVGAVLYWCEGTKSKPANPRYDLTFTNSDVRLVELFVRFVEATGRSRRQLRYRVAIHESADAEAAGRWWAGQLGVEFASFQRPTVKRHNPTTKRINVGADYRGCLVVRVPRSRELYVWMAGVVKGLLSGDAPTPRLLEVGETG